MKLILASASAARQTLLKNAGLAFLTIPAAIDESEVHLSGKKPQDVADALAQAKAFHVSVNYSDAFVIGADQVLESGGHLVTKAHSMDDARKKIWTLRGKEHRLISSVCIVRNNQVLWSHQDAATLRMHNFDGDFLEAYLHKAPAAALRAVGGYELEGAGIWLFDKIEGDYFTILGLPLLPLLAFLRKEGFMP